MLADWERIRAERSDLTDWVIHYTKPIVRPEATTSAIDVLKKILEDGFLIPSSGIRRRTSVGDTQPTIRGPRPAVCFTEQTLGAFAKSCEVLPGRYFGYGVALHKWPLYNYGGRPVIYGDEGLLERLSDDDKFLWVRLQPIPHNVFGSPIDWTHEREWRIVPKRYIHTGLGEWPDDKLLILLPPVFINDEFQEDLPVIIVPTDAQARQLGAWIALLPQFREDNQLLYRVREKLHSLTIVSLEEVRRKLHQGDTRWNKIETLP